MASANLTFVPFGIGARPAGWEYVGTRTTRERSWTADQVTPNPTTRRGFDFLRSALPAVVAGLLAGWLMPRGPVTTAQAVVALSVAIGVGGASGWLLRSRWALLLAPAAFMVVFELARMRVDGPTVDGVRLDGIYGAMGSSLAEVSTRSWSCFRWRWVPATASPWPGVVAKSTKGRGFAWCGAPV